MCDGRVKVIIIITKWVVEAVSTGQTFYSYFCGIFCSSITHFCSLLRWSIFRNLRLKSIEWTFPFYFCNDYSNAAYV